jgi:AcrR family transcriptional regulator
MRRTRIVDALVLEVFEHGYAGTTVTGVCARAQVSRGSFYEQFDGLRDCFLAMMDDGMARARQVIEGAFVDETEWREGIRSALASLLALFDAEPMLARVWLVETLAAGGWALEHRERHIAALTAAIVERWAESAGAQPIPLAVTGVMESVIGLVRAHLLAQGEEPLISLLGQLMSLIVAVYLGAREATVEIERCRKVTARITVGASVAGRRHAADPAVAIPAALADPRAHRARACLRYLLEYPGASNRAVASGVGVSRDDQISTTLARLHRLGLLEKRVRLPGRANAWRLTRHGGRVARVLAAHPHAEERLALAGRPPQTKLTN